MPKVFPWWIRGGQFILSYVNFFEKYKQNKIEVLRFPGTQERNEMEYIIVIDITGLVWYFLRRKLQNFTQYKLVQTLYWERIWSTQEIVNAAAIVFVRNALYRIQHSQVNLERLQN